MIRTTDEISAANDTPKRQSSVIVNTSAFFGPDYNEPATRSLGGFGGLGGFESKGGPVYRSALAKPQYRDFSIQDHFQIGKPKLPGFSLGPGPEREDPPAFGKQFGQGFGLHDFQADLKALELERDYTADYTAPPISTRPQPPLLEARLFDVAEKYGKILPRIKQLYKEEEIFDEKIDEEQGRMEGGWYSERHYQEITFTIRVYEKEPLLNAVEIVRRSGCGFAFGDFMEIAKRILSQGAITPMQLPRFSGELPGVGDVDSIDITPELLAEWIQIIPKGLKQVVAHELQVIAKAAGQKNGIQMTQGPDGIEFVNVLIAKFESCEDQTVARHARKAIQRLQEAGLELSPDDQTRVERKIRQLDRRN